MFSFHTKREGEIERSAGELQCRTRAISGTADQWLLRLVGGAAADYSHS